MADPGELVFKVGPVGYLREADSSHLVVPAIVVNLGIVRGIEAIVQGRNLVAIGSHQDELNQVELVDTGAVLKAMLREGSLQGKPGLSAATEIGVLLPTGHGNEDPGGSVLGVLSQAWDVATLHVNLAAIVTRGTHFDLFGSVIVEGPLAWPVRPAAEIYVDREFGGSLTVSGLAGAIWTWSERLSFDAGARQAQTDGENVTEVRTAFTWALPLGAR